MVQMKVLEVIAGLHRIGGVTTFVGGLSNGLVDKGVDVSIATFRPTGGADDFIPDNRVHILDARNVCVEDFDVVHVHGLWDREIFWASGAALCHKVPFVWSPHGMLSPWSLKFKSWKKFLPWHLYLERRLRRADVLHVTAANEAEWIRELGFVNRIEVVPLGTQLKSVTGDMVEPEKRVLFVGRIHQVKGIENLLKAWALVLSEYKMRSSSCCLDLVGMADAGYQAELSRLVHQLDVEHSVQFLGPKYGKELEQAYQHSWVSVLPSFTENFGGVVIDSLVNKCPVIASSNTPWEGLVNHKCGWWVDNDPNILAKTIIEALNMSNDERIRMGENGRKLVEDSYTWKAVAIKMKDVYESISIP